MRTQRESNIKLHITIGTVLVEYDSKNVENNCFLTTENNNGNIEINWITFNILNIKIKILSLLKNINQFFSNVVENSEPENPIYPIIPIII